MRRSGSSVAYKHAHTPIEIRSAAIWHADKVHKVLVIYYRPVKNRFCRLQLIQPELCIYLLHLAPRKLATTDHIVCKPTDIGKVQLYRDASKNWKKWHSSTYVHIALSFYLAANVIDTSFLEYFGNLWKSGQMCRQRVRVCTECSSHSVERLCVNL